MAEDWSGWEEEEGGGPDLPSIEDILGGLDDLDDENQRLIEEGFELLNLQLDLEEAGDPFAEDADLLLFDDGSLDEGDYGTEDWRLATPSDFEGRLAGPFISFNDAQLYGGELPLQWWDVVYDDEDEVWYVHIPESP